MKTPKPRNQKLELKWKDFKEELEKALEQEPLLGGFLNRIYNRIVQETNRSNDNYFIKNKIFRETLILYSDFFSSIEKKFFQKKHNVDSIEKLEEKTHDFVIPLGPRMNKIKIIRKLEEVGSPPIIYTTKEVFKNNFKKLKTFKDSSIILEDVEFKSLHPNYYKKMNRRSEKGFKKILNSLNNDQISFIFNKNEAYIKYYLKKQYLKKIIYEKIFSTSRPKAIISGGFKGAKLISAKEYNIKTIMIQHGIQWGDKSRVTQECDELIIWGEFWRENFKNQFDNNPKLVPLGAPRYDEVLKYRNAEKNKRFFKKHDLNSSQPVVTFLSQAVAIDKGTIPKKLYFKVINDLESIIDENENYIIKLHPDDEKKYFVEAMNEVTLKRSIFIKENLYKVLAYSDLVISFSSTALLETMAMLKPFIQYIPDKKRSSKSILFMEEVLAQDKQELEKLKKKILNDKEFREKLIRKEEKSCEKFLKNLGNATESIVEYLLNL